MSLVFETAAPALRTAPAGQPLSVTLSTGESIDLVLKDYF